jgi:hypothetical protein
MLFFPIFLYAETHYRFKYFFSLYKKSEPEIIADAPHRLDPDKQYPIMILVKDSHLYPVELLSVKVTLFQNAKKIYSHTFECLPAMDLSTHYWSKIVEIPFQGALSSIFGLMLRSLQNRTANYGSPETTIIDLLRKLR